MPPAPPTLHMLCGKIASGKSTLAARLARAEGSVLVSEDDWLSALYADEMTSLKDYARCSRRLRRVMGPHVAALLNAGLSVVLDFAANTAETRGWMRGILDATGARHELHVIDVPGRALPCPAAGAQCTGRPPLRGDRGAVRAILQPPRSAHARRRLQHRAPRKPPGGLSPAPSRPA